VLSEAQRGRLKERDKFEQQANALGAQGKTAEAIRAAEAMLAIECEVLGRTSDDAVRSIKLLAQLNADREDWTAARKAWTEVLAMWTRKLGKNNEEVTEARWALEKIDTLTRLSDHDRGRVKEAVHLDRRAKELFARGKVNEAVAMLREVAGIRKELLGDLAPEYVSSLLNLGVALRNQGKGDEALGCYTRAMQISQEICGNSHPLLVVCLDRMAAVQEERGNHAEARQHLERALSHLSQAKIPSGPSLPRP
jgi:tetratricopeptide (TPR) repeat protein